MVLALAWAMPAAAETRLCNRTSVIVEAAVGVVAGEAAATRGWYRLDPGQCRPILQTADAPGRLFVHTRPHDRSRPVSAGLPENAALCVSEADFLLSGAQACRQASDRLAPFAEIRPTVVEDVAIAFLSEDADYDLPQARRAGIQRLLAEMGYDPGPVDGLDGPRTEAAFRAFATDARIDPEAAGQPDIFDRLLAALRAGEGPGFAWCNDTGHRVMAALGIEEAGRIVTRGWFRVDPGACLKPAIEGAPARVLSYGEAVDADGRPVRVQDTAVTFGGDVPGCIRPSEFEIAGADDCASHGASQAGFLSVAFDGRRRASVRFRLP
ncbi:DUF1036 domain-containing protein [Phreatobacter sp.]|uniref:DUF1036 domain-containing protein n=1 Tax=Phreatobacter sp. TaxID=1966341 RepID=UPI003F715EC2